MAVKTWTRAEIARETIIDQIQGAVSFRENLIPKDKPWNPKNEKYARTLRSILECAKSIPAEHPMFQRLACCDYLFDPDDGFKIDDFDWAALIHAQTNNPGQWFEDWVSSGIKEN